MGNFDVLGRVRILRHLVTLLEAILEQGGDDELYVETLTNIHKALIDITKGIIPEEEKEEEDDSNAEEGNTSGQRSAD